MSTVQRHRHRVVVVGAGFAGLSATRALARLPVDVTLIDANNFHTFQPLLYQVATAGLDADDIAHAVRGIFQRQRNVDVLMARLVGLDERAKTVQLDRGEPVPYDSLVLACGAVSNDFGIDGVLEHAFPLKTLDDAITLRTHLLDCFERASLDDSLVVDGVLDVVVSGGGPTGVEMAGGIAELFQRVLAKDFPSLPVGRARILLVEPMDRLLAAFAESSSARARSELERHGVEVRLGVGVAKVEPTRVELTDGTTVPAHTTVWAAGVKANPLGARLGLPTTKGGRVVVTPELHVPERPDIFVIGDLAAAPSPGVEGPLPQLAQPALQAGRHVAAQIRRRLHGEPLRPFLYSDKGSMATIGRREAVAELPSGLKLHGTLGWFAWLGLHLVYLMGFRNRLNVFVNWCWNYLTYDRGSRILSESERSRTLRSTAAPDGH